MEHLIVPASTQLDAKDRNKPDWACTAIHIMWPDTFSDKAKRSIQYFDDTAFLFIYDGKFVVTDESLELTPFGDGSMDAPFGGPRFIAESLDDVENWLEFISDMEEYYNDNENW